MSDRAASSDNLAPAPAAVEQLRICTSPECHAKFKNTEGLVEISESGEVEHLA